MAKDIADHRFHVVRLARAAGEGLPADRLGVDHLEEERAALLLSRHWRPAAQRWQGAADEGCSQFVDQRQRIALVLTERQQRDRLVGIGGRLAFPVDRSIGGERLPLAFELLHPSHGDDGGCPVDDDRKPDGLRGRKAPGMGVGAERGKNSLERHHFRQRGSAVGVGDVAAFGCLHHIPAAPQIVECIIDRDRAGAVGVGQPHAGLHRLPSHCLAELFAGIPHLRGGEPGGEFFDCGPRHAPARF